MAQRKPHSHHPTVMWHKIYGGHVLLCLVSRFVTVREQLWSVSEPKWFFAFLLYVLYFVLVLFYKDGFHNY